MTIYTMHRFTLRQLDYLIACVDCGSVAAAAERLNVSQPTISVAVAKLEDQLGVQLLLRHQARGVTATASADRILPSARSLLAHAVDLERTARESGTEVAGNLRLGSFSTLAPMVLPGLIEALAVQHPAVRLTVSEGPQDVLLTGLLQGRLDLALLYDIGLPDGLRHVPLAERAPYAALSPDHPLAAGPDVALSDLAPEPLILLEIEPSRGYFLSLFEAAGLTPHVAHSSPSIELVRGMVGRGLGYSLLVTRPDGDKTYDGQHLAVRPLRDSVALSRVVLASLADLRPTRLMRSFETLAQDAMRNKD